MWSEAKKSPRQADPDAASGNSFSGNRCCKFKIVVLEEVVTLTQSYSHCAIKHVVPKIHIGSAQLVRRFRQGWTGHGGSCFWFLKPYDVCPILARGSSDAKVDTPLISAFSLNTSIFASIFKESFSVVRLSGIFILLLPVSKPNF